jgi:ADP-ribose pyrophosphatase YjhB (NUDIX family)
MGLAACAGELYRLVRRPHTLGALVAIWWREQRLLSQTSYQRCNGLPGGGLQRGETAAQAAVRELQEDAGAQGAQMLPAKVLDAHRTKSRWTTRTGILSTHSATAAAAGFDQDLDVEL